MKLRILIILFSALFGFGCTTTTSSQGGSRTELLTNSDKTDLQKRADIRLELAIGYYQQRQLEVALDEVKQALSILPNFPDAYSLRGLIYMDIGQTLLADDNFQKAIKLSPDNPDFLNNYGWFLCQNGRPQQSISYFELALKNKAYQSPQKALANAGGCSLKVNDTVAAERYFSQALSLEPNNAAVNFSLAKLHYARGEYERARFYLGRAAQGDKTTPEMLWVGIKIERKRGDKPSEIAMANQLRRRYPNSNEYATYQRGAFDE